jgi:hypothetical protein
MSPTRLMGQVFQNGDAMTEPIDIFRLESEKSVLWVGKAASVEMAKRHVANLIQEAPADYLILSQRTGEKTFVKMDAAPSE